jgi:CRISPR-associated protein (TIGR02710 family)
MRRLAKETAGRLQRGEFFTFLDRVGEAYDHWDGFRYEVALPVLRRAEREIGTMACAASSEHVDDFHTTLMEHVGHVDAVIKAYKLLAGHVAGNGKTLDPKPFLADLLANAARRAESGRYDDAVARLYCAIEKIAKIRLQVGYGLNTSDIDLDLVPENERADLLECRSDEGKIRLPLARSYELLRRLGDPLGESYKQRSQQLDQVLYQRNNSFLAHGFTPMGEKHYQKLMDISLEFLGINEDELPKFPKMDWEGMVL